MDNNDVTQSITKTLMGPSSDVNVSSNLNSNSGSNGSSSFFDSLSNISITTWIIIILILAVLGFNVFIYFAKGTQDIASFIKKILGFFGIVTGQVVDVSAEGAKGVVGATQGAVNVTADAIKSGLTDIQKLTPEGSKATSSVQGQNLSEQKNQMLPSQEAALNNTLSQTKPQNIDYQADEASSSIQGNIPKSGWCYIGSDRNFRSCAYVGIDDKCMSGEIFPSQEICVNPNLRA
jgi:hypothetical protein